MNDYFCTTDAIYKEFHGAIFYNDKLICWNNWSQTEFVKEIVCKWKKEHYPFLDRVVYTDSWYEMDGTFIWTLGENIHHDGGYIGEIGWMNGLFYPPLAKLSLAPYVGEIIAPEGWSVDLKSAEPKKIHYPKYFTYKTLQHYDKWGPWNDVWRTALVEHDKEGDYGRNVYNYFFARGLGLVQFLQASTEQPGTGKVWVMKEKLAEHAEPDIPPSEDEPIYAPEEPEEPKRLALPDVPVNFYGATHYYGCLHDYAYCWIKKAFWQCLNYAMQEINPVDPFLLMSGCRQDGTPPPSTNFHRNWSMVDLRYSTISGQETPKDADDIDYPDLINLMEYMAEIRDKLYPKIDFSFLVYYPYKWQILERFPDIEQKLNIRIVGNPDDDRVDDMEHKEHLHITSTGRYDRAA